MTPSPVQMSMDDRRRVMETAMGIDKADLMVRNARLVNVYTGQIVDSQSVSVKGQWIAYVGDNAEHTVGPDTVVIDADGQTLMPGLIDGHTHLAWLFSPDTFLARAMACGTTTVVTETIEPFPVAGLAGVEDFLDALADQPVRIFATAPPMMSISTLARGIAPEDLDRLLGRPEILGLGESYWQAMLQETDRMLPLFQRTLAAGKCVEGHSAGASRNKMMAYFAAGVSSCHEPITADEVLERLRLGVHVMIREGSIRGDLAEISRIRDTGIDCRRLILVTDGITPGDLMEKGYMDHVVQKAIDCGFSPVAAIQMATLNVAEHFSLDGIIGGIGPGRQADMLIVPDPMTIDPKVVMARGRIIAREGRLLAEPRKHRWAQASLDTIRLPRRLEPEDFVIAAPADQATAQVRVIELITSLVTLEASVGVAVQERQVPSDPANDILKVAAIDRTHAPGQCFVGLVRGFGIRSGAIASSAAWDTSDIVVVGANDRDMADAVNRVSDLKGGAVICVNGAVMAELALPIFGLMSDLPLEKLARRTADLNRAAADLGCPHPEPVLTLITLTGQAIPFLRICEQGLVNLKNGRTLGLFI